VHADRFLLDALEELARELKVDVRLGNARTSRNLL
jgi:hypothetical protein